MTNIDPETLARTARRYIALRRASTLSFLLPFPLILADLLVHPNLFFFLSIGLLVILCMVTFAITSLTLFNFPCLRCHQPFTRGVNGSFPAKKCKGCGLELSRKIARPSHA